MYYVILILGGLLIMMGQHARSEALFYYFKLDEYIPANHLLRLIDKHISLAFVRERLKDSYSETGRPSIDPELLLRILLIGYLYGITREHLSGGERIGGNCQTAGLRPRQVSVHCYTRPHSRHRSRCSSGRAPLHVARAVARRRGSFLVGPLGVGCGGVRNVGRCLPLCGNSPADWFGNGNGARVTPVAAHLPEAPRSCQELFERTFTG